MYSSVGFGGGHDGTCADLKIQYLPNTMLFLLLLYVKRFVIIFLSKNVKGCLFKKCGFIGLGQSSCPQQSGLMALLGWLCW